METFVVIDVEMCRVRKSAERAKLPFAQEIIQIGAVMMNGRFELTGNFSSYVRPALGQIDPYIRRLTGIRPEDVSGAPKLSEVLDSLLLWIGERAVTFYSWSETDYWQIRSEILSKGLDSARFSLFLDRERWIDYQQKVDERFCCEESLSLKKALEYAEIEVQGRLHDGLCDAVNTAQLISELTLDPKKKRLGDILAGERKKQAAPLSASLASLLGGLTLCEEAPELTA